jgi:hypothetical protein
MLPRNISWGIKTAGSYACCLEICESKIPGKPRRTCPVLYRDYFNFLCQMWFTNEENRIEGQSLWVQELPLSNLDSHWLSWLSFSLRCMAKYLCLVIGCNALPAVSCVFSSHSTLQPHSPFTGLKRHNDNTICRCAATTTMPVVKLSCSLYVRCNDLFLDIYF